MNLLTTTDIPRRRHDVLLGALCGLALAVVFGWWHGSLLHLGGLLVVRSFYRAPFTLKTSLGRQLWTAYASLLGCCVLLVYCPRLPTLWAWLGWIGCVMGGIATVCLARKGADKSFENILSR